MVALVLIYGYNVWLGGFLGNVAINFWYFHHHDPKNYLPFIFSAAVFSTLESLTCGWLLNHPLKWKDGRVILPPQVPNPQCHFVPSSLICVSVFFFRVMKFLGTFGRGLFSGIFFLSCDLSSFGDLVVVCRRIRKGR
jgi:hypothetical protein